MAGPLDNERSPLLKANGAQASPMPGLYGGSARLKDDSIVDETEMADTSVGERLPYNDYTTIDQLHDLVHGGATAPCKPSSAD